ncbi:MAG: glutamate--tRNA ligase [bacterium]
MKTVRTRFAPSPTGFLHIGSLRTALFSYLFAKHSNGKFILRIEDTDRERLVEGGVLNILKSLKWAGIEPDEGIVLDKQDIIQEKGNYGPYIQSNRIEIYQNYVEQLIENDHAYYCFCDKERLSSLRKKQQEQNIPTGYDRKCRDISMIEAKKRVQNGDSYVIRMKTPLAGKTDVKDLLRGKIVFENKLIDDFILLKADRYPTYHFAVVVDDHLMKITHIIRGEEWIPSTPKHIQLYDMLGWEKPKFVHIPLLVNEKKQKLSKRHNDTSVRDYIEKGYLPEALINFVALLGWNPGNEQEIFSIKELKSQFETTRILKAPAVFNSKKLDWFNQQYLRSKSGDELVEIMMPFLTNYGYNNSQIWINDKKWVGKVINLERERASTLQDLSEAVSFVFTNHLEYKSELLIWKKSTKDACIQGLNGLNECLNKISIQDWESVYIKKSIGDYIENNDFTNGSVLWPMRVALSGQENSPGPFEIAEVLGKKITLERIKNAIESLNRKKTGKL